MNLIVVIGSLKKSKGELVGVKGKKYYAEKPFGMVLVPGGSFIMGKSDDDIAGIQDAPQKTVTVRSFYMDETEITNSEYRQFVNWVRDSIIRTALAERAKELMDIGPVDNTGENEGGIIQNYAYLGSEEEKTPYQKFDSILYISVLEHIKNDTEEIEVAISKIKKNGHLIVCVPAHNYMYSKFDKEIGHYRRYNKKFFEELNLSSGKLKECYMLDVTGWLMYFLNKLVSLEQSIISAERLIDNDCLLPLLMVTCSSCL